MALGYNYGTRSKGKAQDHNPEKTKTMQITIFGQTLTLTEQERGYGLNPYAAELADSEGNTLITIDITNDARTDDQESTVALTIHQASDEYPALYQLRRDLTWFGGPAVATSDNTREWPALDAAFPERADWQALVEWHTQIVRDELAAYYEDED